MIKFSSQYIPSILRGWTSAQVSMEFAPNNSAQPMVGPTSLTRWATSLECWVSIGLQI
jgi:hypothetical protein